MKRYYSVLISFAVIVVPICELQAKSRYQPFESRDPIREGNGGTKLTKNGIDYWSNGDPPRRYKILGIILDKRSMSRLAGDAIGSKSVAKVAIEAGGDAVILMSQNTKITGSIGGVQAYGSGSQTYGNGWSAAVGKEIAQLIVVKYLD